MFLYLTLKLHSKAYHDVLQAQPRARRALASDTTINRSCFLKLLALGLFDILLTLPIEILAFVLDLSQDNIVGFWPGWKVAHASFSTIPTATSGEWKSAGFWPVFTIRFSQWINSIFAVAFFILFGITEQKRAWYRSIFWKVVRPFGLKPRVNPATSNIVFGPGPPVNSATGDTRGTVM